VIACGLVWVFECLAVLPVLLGLVEERLRQRQQPMTKVHERNPACHRSPLDRTLQHNRRSLELWTKVADYTILSLFAWTVVVHLLTYRDLPCLPLCVKADVAHFCLVPYRLSAQTDARGSCSRHRDVLQQRHSRSARAHHVRPRNILLFFTSLDLFATANVSMSCDRARRHVCTHYLMRP
jgi:hypothetical protein